MLRLDIMSARNAGIKNETAERMGAVMAKKSNVLISNAWDSFHDNWFSECKSDEDRLELVDDMIRRLMLLKASIGTNGKEKHYICKGCGTIYRLKIPYCKVCQSRMDY